MSRGAFRPGARSAEELWEVTRSVGRSLGTGHLGSYIKAPGAQRKVRAALPSWQRTRPARSLDRSGMVQTLLLPPLTASWLTCSALDVGTSCPRPRDWEHVRYSESHPAPLGGFSLELGGGRWRARFYLCVPGRNVGFIPEDSVHFGVASTSLQQREQDKPHRHIF